MYLEVNIGGLLELAEDSVISGLYYWNLKIGLGLFWVWLLSGVWSRDIAGCNCWNLSINGCKLLEPSNLWMQLLEPLSTEFFEPRQLGLGIGYFYVSGYKQFLNAVAGT